MAGDRRFPRRSDTVRLERVGRQKPLPDAQLRQEPSDFRWHRFANTQILVSGLLDYCNEKPAAAQIERDGGPSRSAARHEHIE